MGHVVRCLVCLVLGFLAGQGQFPVFEPVTDAFEVEDFGVVDDAVDHG